jgi:hypothetical protein
MFLFCLFVLSTSAIDYYQVRDLVLENTNFTASTNDNCLTLWSCRNVTVRFSAFRNCRIGLLTNNCTDIYIEANTFEFHERSIHVETSSNVHILRNTAKNSLYVAAGGSFESFFVLCTNNLVFLQVVDLDS